MCECVRASRGARGLGSGATPVISQEPRAAAAHREPAESLSAVSRGRRGTGQSDRCQRGETPESSDVVGGSAGSAAGFLGIREMVAFVSFGESGGFWGGGVALCLNTWTWSLADMFGFSQQSSGSSLRDGLQEFPPLSSLVQLGFLPRRLKRLFLPSLFAVSLLPSRLPFAPQD